MPAALSTALPAHGSPHPTLSPSQVLEGRNGAKNPGFQATHRSTLHTSPLLYDFDFDGTQDIVVATYDGEIQFFTDAVSAPARRCVPAARP